MVNEVQMYYQNDFIKFKEFEGKDLSYSIFEKVDFHKFIHSVSFYRSDFRGTKFTNINFYKNNFDRSDFLSAIIIDCTFDKVQFGCCQMKNCYFKNVRFTNNFYRNTSIHSTTFVDCEFPDETFLINMQHCKLINCTFSGCSFEMSTTDSNIFEKCKFINTNLATMHAENHKFIECELENVCIGSSYFFGYSIANCTLKQVVFLYRGERISFESLKLSEFIEKFEREHRFNDMLNLFISSNAQSQIPNLIKECFDYYKNISYGRMLDISVILESLSFAAIYETVDYEFLHDSLTTISEADLSSYNFDERIEIEALYTKLQNALYLSEHSEEYLARIDANRKSVLSIRFKSDDYDECILMARQLLNSISDADYWTLIEKQKGSWILIYSVATMVALSALPKIIKNYADVYFDIKTKKVISNKILQKLENTDVSFKDIKKLTAATQEAELTLPAGKCINKNISKEIATITAHL